MAISREPQVAVIGAGSWGTTVASIVARNAPTVLWARNSELAEEISVKHTNQRYLPDRPLSPKLTATSSLEEAAGGADVLVMAVPSHGFRAVLEQVEPFARAWLPIVSLTKGLEQGTHARMTEIVEEVMPGHPAGILAGPNLAREVLDGLAAAAVIAMPDEHVASALQDIFRTTVFRVYASTDVVGTEIAGPLKNVYAIAAGMAAGFETGENTRALIMARSLAEMTRLGVALGGAPATFAGLAGLGDLLATCNSPLSRNRQVGVELAKGRAIADIIESMSMVAEGVKASRVVMELGERHGVELPIAAQVDAIIHEGRRPEDAFVGLLRTRPGTEAEAG